MRQFTTLNQTRIEGGEWLTQLYSNSSNGRHGIGDSKASAAFVSSTPGVEVADVYPEDPSPEVTVPLKRQRRTAAYKLRMLLAADACERRGDLGALLRQAGLYHSDLANWRKQKAQGLLNGSPASRARRSDPEFVESMKKQIELSRENRELRRQLGRAKLIIEIQKKAALLLGETLQEMSLDDFPEDDLD